MQRFSATWSCATCVLVNSRQRFARWAGVLMCVFAGWPFHLAAAVPQQQAGNGQHECRWRQSQMPARQYADVRACACMCVHACVCVWGGELCSCTGAGLHVGTREHMLCACQNTSGMALHAPAQASASVAANARACNGSVPACRRERSGAKSRSSWGLSR